MGEMDTTYNRGNVRTVTSGAPVAAIDPSLVEMAKQMMQLKLDAARAAVQPAAAPAPPIPGRGRAQPVAAGSTKVGFGGSGKSIQQRMQELAFRNMQNELSAKEMAPPTRMVTGAGVVMGPTADVDRFSAYQRQLYLPNNAQGGTGF